jgi:phosphopantetheinyl transferase
MEPVAERMLEPRELAHAARGRPAVRRARLASAVALRIALARRLGRPPETLRVVRTPRGKPSLAEPAGLHFSLSRCGDVALIALTTLGPVGVDVERAADAAWTRIEAYLKATGAGVTALDDGPVVIDPRAWTVRGVDAGEGLAASVAVRGVHDLGAVVAHELALEAAWV